MIGNIYYYSVSSRRPGRLELDRTTAKRLGTGLVQHQKKPARMPEYDQQLAMVDAVISTKIEIKDVADYLNKWHDIPAHDLPDEINRYCFEIELNGNITRIIYQMLREYGSHSEFDGNVLVFLATKVKMSLIF